MKNQNTIELLAPAGDLSCLKVAVDRGANAVYLGARSFSARASATNFDKDTLLEGVRYAHAVGCKIYLAINTLIKEQEIDEFLKVADEGYLCGVDAFIVADIYLGRILKERYSDIEVHLSTQAGVNTVDGARLAKSYGLDRVILARETPIDRIQEIATILPTEVFVQGALCTCYSGHCYMSSMIGGMSGNRGRCKQPCRREYSVDGGDMKYSISLSDLSLGEDIKKLVKAGVTSFKIEGRMRGEAYVGEAVAYYRHILDGESADISPLKRAYNRNNYTRGLAFGQKDDLISSKIQGHIGERVGKVISIEGSRAIVQIEKPLIGNGYKIIRDGLEVGSGYCSNDKEVRGGYSLDIKGAISRDDEVYITTDKRKIEYDIKRIPIELSIKLKAGEKICLSAKTEGYKVTLEGDIVQEAKAQPLRGEDIKNCLIKVDKYPYAITKLKVDIVDNVFLPKSSLNDIRRRVYDMLYESIVYRKRVSKYAPIEPTKLVGHKSGKVAVIVDDMIPLGDEVDIVIYSPTDTADKSTAEAIAVFYEGKQIYLEMPAFLSDKCREEIKELLPYFKGVYLTGLAGRDLAREYGKEIFVGTDCNLSNSIDIATAEGDEVAISKEITTLEAKSLTDSGAYYMAGGSIKIMDLIYCPRGHKCNRCTGKDITLTDYEGRTYRVRRRIQGGECRFEMYYDSVLYGNVDKSINRLYCLIGIDEDYTLALINGERDILASKYKLTTGHIAKSVL